VSNILYYNGSSFFKNCNSSSLKFSVSTMVSLTDTHMITFTHNIIPIIQTQISTRFQGHQCTRLFSVNPDMLKLSCCPLSSPCNPLSLTYVLFLYLPSSFFTYHPLSVPTILFLCCSVLVLHHIILFLHCPVYCLHNTLLFGCRQSSNGLQKILSNSISLLVALHSIFDVG
jgi:hypothetical protein